MSLCIHFDRHEMLWFHGAVECRIFVNLAMLLQADGVDMMPVVNGHIDTVDVTDASAARGGDEVSQTQQSRQSAHTSASASATSGNEFTRLNNSPCIRYYLSVGRVLDCVTS